MAGNRPIPKLPQPAGVAAPAGLAASFSSAFLSSSPLAQQVLARDLEECSDDDLVDTDALDVLSDSDSDKEPGPTLYRRPSGIAFGTARPALGPGGLDEPFLTAVERHRSRDAERSLLRDNHLLPPKHPAPKRPGFLRSLYKRMFSTKVPIREEDEEAPRTAAVGPSETSPLLGGTGENGGHGHDHLNEQWEAAVAAGQIKTTWQREAQTLAVYSRSLIVTFLLQYSINVASIFAVGRIGKVELGAVSRKFASNSFSEKQRKYSPSPHWLSRMSDSVRSWTN